MKLKDYQKSSIEKQCEPLIQKLKSQYVKEEPASDMYLVDVFLKWHGASLYLCGRYKCEASNCISDEYNDRIVRLKHTQKGLFDIAYMRHNEKWLTIAEQLPLSECLEMIETVPALHPMP